MKCISAVTIGKLIQAHMEHDEEKFLAYANFIADAYEESGEERSAKIVRSKISGEYKNQLKATLDSEQQNKNAAALLMMLGLAAGKLSHRKYPYTTHNGEKYEGTIYMTEGVGFHDGQGHKIEFM